MNHRHDPVLLAGLAVCVYVVVKYGPQTARLLVSGRWRDGLQYAVSLTVAILAGVFFATEFGLIPTSDLYKWVGRGAESQWFFVSIIALAALASRKPSKVVLPID